MKPDSRYIHSARSVLKRDFDTNWLTSDRRVLPLGAPVLALIRRVRPRDGSRVLAEAV
jgi:hypothetical protein